MKKATTAVMFIIGMALVLLIMAFSQHVFGQKTKPQIMYCEHSLSSSNNDTAMLGKINVVYVVNYVTLELYNVKAVHIDGKLGRVDVTVALNMNKFYCEQKVLGDELYFIVEPYFHNRYQDQDENGFGAFPDKRQLVCSYSLGN